MKNVLFAVTLIASAVAFADNGDRMAQLDADNSGAVSSVEAQADARLDSKFAALDADNNGELDAAELNTYANR